MTGTPYIEDIGTSSPLYAPSTQNSPTTKAVFHLVSNGDNTWKIVSALNGNYWPAPTQNERLYPTTLANAGNWAIAISSGTATFTCQNGSTTYGLDRLTPDVVGWSSRKTVQLYEVSAAELSTSAPFSEFTDKDISVRATEAATVTTGTWYVMSQRSRTSYVYEDASSHTLKHTQTKPSGSAVTNANYLVRLVNGTDGKYYIQTGLGNYVGQITASTNVPTTALMEEALTVEKIASTDGHYYVQCASNSVVLDANDFTLGDPATVVGWGTTAPTATGSNNDWAFYPVEFENSWVPTISEVYTINNTNTNRGALIYDPDNSTTYVWSSGKSGATAFDANNANHQWVIVPTATEKQYYLYNVGAGKFAIPTGAASGNAYPWVFSDNAVAVVFLTQSDGTKKIQMAKAPVSGNNVAYAAVSNGQTYPIINYNDVGGNFTITKVDGVDQSAAATAAVGKLAESGTALSAMPASDSEGWYVVRIKTHGSYADRFVYPASTPITYNGTVYPMTFDNTVNVRPTTNNVTYYTRISNEGGTIYWQMPNGQYLYGSGSKFPLATTEKQSCSMDYSTSGFRFWGSSRYAVPYYLGSQYFIGETATATNAYYDLYPIDLTEAGMEAWQVVCDQAPASSQISCSRSDICGLTTVYKGGYFFLPTGVTPEASEFSLEGASGATVDATAKTITMEYDPNLAMVEGSITTAQGWQTAGRGGEVMLLKVDAAPFKDATNVSLSVNLKDGSEANISKLTLYEASTNSPEIYSTGTGAPTKTQIDQVSVSGSTATFNIGNLTTGNHYYWIGATVKDDATLGAVIDLAVTGITYTCNSNETVLDLTSVGDPADRGAMVFNTQSYAFLPRDNGSRVYRIPAMVVADDGSIVVACDKRYDSHSDIGGGHVIDIVIRRSTDGGKTWSAPVTIAKGEGSTASGGDDKRCGFGDPSLVKGKDGKLYCLFAAGNEGYFYGQKGMCMSVSTDNGVTWSSGEGNPPVDLYWSGAIKNVSTAGAEGYGLYDYFVTSGRGLYIPEDDILMYLIPAQTMTSATEHTSNSHDYVFYSTDGGTSWYFSPTPMFTGGDEAKIIQANDGSLIGSVRQSYNRGFNTATYTKNSDGTLSFTWGTQYNNSQLSAGGYANNQDIFYYSRASEGDRDILLHTMTTGQHANLNLYISVDGGSNWTQVCQLQSKGTRYVTMDKLSNGDLAFLFEDQSLNSAGGYTDYNHYPINFLTITKEQIEAMYDKLVGDMYQSTASVKNSVYGTTTGCDSYGGFSDTGSGHWARTWTSNATSGFAGLTVSTESGYGFDKATVLGTRVMTLKPSANEATDTYTITAPAGYVITGYTIGGAVYTSGTYRITAADGTTTGDITSTTTPTDITVSNVNASSTTFTFYGASQNNWFAITNFTINLAATKEVAMTVVGDASYSTLYLPYAVTLPENTKAYAVSSISDGQAVLAEITDAVPAATPVILINSASATSVLCPQTSTATAYTGMNLLRGTLISRTLDLSDATQYYALGRKSDKIGFYKYDNGGTTTITLGANKAYLETPAQSNPSKGFIFTYDDPTAIASIVNGQSSMVNGQWYTLDGRKLNGKPTAPGIYIINKKKVLVK